MKTSLNVHKCWIAYFDILGFKEKIKKSNGDYASIVKVYRNVLNELKSHEEIFKDIKICFAWFSDSFLIYSKDDTDKSFAQLYFAATNFIESCLKLKSKCPVSTGSPVEIAVESPIPMRGAITFGPFFTDEKENIFIGEALVEAIKEAEKQNWIGLIMTKTAVDQVQKNELMSGIPSCFMEVEIPVHKHKNESLEGCLAYTFSTSASVNSYNPFLGILNAMKMKAPVETHEKYEDTINHISRFDRYRK